jgi:glutamate-1-semialdehyde aminotransferase
MPDMTTLGKVLGGGLPIAAFATKILFLTKSVPEPTVESMLKSNR